MDSRFAAPDLAVLDTADRIGRAAYLWLRQHRARQEDARRHDAGLTQRQNRYLAAGFIAELCTLLELTPRHGLCAAYTFALLDHRDEDALCIAAILMESDGLSRESAMFEQGRVMATGMLELIEAEGFGRLAEADVPGRAFRLDG